MAQFKDAIIMGVCRVLGKVYSPEFVGKLTGNADTSTKATQDSAGQQINTTYIKGLSASGTTVTYTKGDGTTGTITTQDTNTDTKVTQTAVTSSSYTNWRPIVWGASNSGTEGFTPTTVTDSTFTADTLSCQPSSGTIRATTFKGTLNGNASTATKWATARNINGLSVDGSANRVNYATCSTAAATAAKVVDCTGFALITGSEITVKFTITNTASSPTLNVNGTGAKSIYYRGSAISAGYLAANRTYTFRYNGTQYELVGDINTNTTYSTGTTSTSGLTKLYTATGTATDGTMTQNAITTELNNKSKVTIVRWT